MTSGSRDTFSTLARVSHETLARFDSYADLLTTWTRTINLISPATVADVWGRHFLDSAQLVPLLPAGALTLADLGSGAGFPGLVIALLTDLHVHLVESDQRKAAFLREVSRVTKAAHVTVHATRLLDLAPLSADVVTSRALAPLPTLIPWAARHLKPGGTALFLKGADAEKEVANARKTCSFTCDVFPSHTSPDGQILRLMDLETRTPA